MSHFLILEISCSIFFFQICLEVFYTEIILVFQFGLPEFWFLIGSAWIGLFDYFLNGDFAFSLLFKLNWNALKQIFFLFWFCFWILKTFFEQKWFESKVLLSFYFRGWKPKCFRNWKVIFSFGVTKQGLIYFIFFFSCLVGGASPLKRFCFCYLKS